MRRYPLNVTLKGSQNFKGLEIRIIERSSAALILDIADEKYAMSDIICNCIRININIMKTCSDNCVSALMML